MKRIKFKKGSKLKKFIDNSGEIKFHKQNYHSHLKIAKKRTQAKNTIAQKLENSHNNMFEKAKKIGII